LFLLVVFEGHIVQNDYYTTLIISKNTPKNSHLRESFGTAPK